MKSDRAEIQFILVLFHWLKPLTDEGREETVVPRKEKKKKKNRRGASENATYLKPQSGLEPCIGGRRLLGKQKC